MLTLLDLSNNNPTPNWTAVKKGGAFGVLLKVSEGGTFIDQTWADRSRQARSAGLHVGGYHFARPRVGSAPDEARFFCKLLGKVQRRDLHPALDFERDDNHLSPLELLTWIRWFQREVHHLTGARCLLYSYSAFIREQGWKATPGTGAGLWLADYGPDDGKDHGANVPLPWRRFVAHQFTSEGSWPGVTGHVDLSHAKRRRKVLANGLRGIA